MGKWVEELNQDKVSNTKVNGQVGSRTESRQGKQYQG